MTCRRARALLIPLLVAASGAALPQQRPAPAPQQALPGLQLPGARTPAPAASAPQSRAPAGRQGAGLPNLGGKERPPLGLCDGT
jgi:hypothetical protein